MEFSNTSGNGIISFAVEKYGDPIQAKFFSCSAQSTFPGSSCTYLFNKRGGWVSYDERGTNYFQFNVLEGSLTLQSIKIWSNGGRKGLTSWYLQGSDDFVNYYEIGNNQGRNFCSNNVQTFAMSQVKPMKSYRFVINGKRCYDSELYSAEVHGIELYGKVTAWKSPQKERPTYFGTILIPLFIIK